MTVEIRELIIRAIVEDKNVEGEESGHKSGADFTGDEKIVAEAVEQTLAVLEKKKER